MFKLISVTNRRLACSDFLTQIKKVAEGGADAVILREKDLSEAEYEALAKEALEICNSTKSLCILHTFASVAEKLESEALHMPLPLLREMPEEERSRYKVLGASCHSMEDVREAEALGCTYVTLGHIFATDCKKGVPPRGLGLLKEVCREANISVYAIGGISAENVASVKEAGAAGTCLMSLLMLSRDPGKEISKIKENLK